METSNSRRKAKKTIKIYRTEFFLFTPMSVTRTKANFTGLWRVLQEFVSILNSIKHYLRLEMKILYFPKKACLTFVDLLVCSRRSRDRLVLEERVRWEGPCGDNGWKPPSSASFPVSTLFARSPCSPFTRFLQTESLGLDSEYPS